MRVTLFRDHPAEGWPSMDRYAENLAASLRQVLPPKWQIAMPMPPDPWSVPYGQLLVRTLRYPLWARRQQADVSHITDHSYGALLLALDPEHTVVTVHDIAPLRFPGRRVGISGLAWRIAWQGIKRARHVIVDSAFTAVELETLLGYSPKHLCVVPLAVSSDFKALPVEQVEQVRQCYVAAGERLVLHVGHTQRRKNLETLLHALAMVQQQGIRAVLVQVGGRPTETQAALVRDLQLQSAVRFTGQVDDDTLVRLYNAADVFVFPSLYEGFGMPVLEAMICGAPVITGDVTSLPEVAGDAGLLVDPRSSQKLSEAIARVLTDSDLAAELRRRGLMRARQFTWERTARETMAVYQSMLGEN